ncbi:MAG: phosphoesterase [Nitrospirales bacterium]|nr:phosphoesterase [Nitrospirales bacterium]
MNALRFVHAADLHLDSPFRGLSEVAPGLQSIMQEATFQAFQGIVDLCLQQKVDFLIIAGDIHDSSNRSLRALVRLRNEFERLAEHHIPVLLCHGNHDPLSGWGAKFSWPKNVHVFKSGEVEAQSLYRNDIEIARVYGVSYATEQVSENLAKAFCKEDDAPWSIGLLHTNVGHDPNHHNYAPCTIQDLLEAHMDYWALGHVHTHRVLHKAHPTIIYPGNSQGRHPREPGPRGCVLVNVRETGQVQYELVPVDVVRWYDETISIEGKRDLEELLSHIDDHIHRLCQQNGNRSLVIRWILEGRSPLHHELTKPGRLEDILSTLRDKWGTGSVFVWSESIQDHTKRAVDIDALRLEDNLLGDFLRLMSQRDPTFLEELKGAVAPLFDDPRIARYVKAPSDDQFRAWMHMAEQQGIDRLMAGEE